jgi:hypothetical protein
MYQFTYEENLSEQCGSAFLSKFAAFENTAASPLEEKSAGV